VVEPCGCPFQSFAEVFRRIRGFQTALPTIGRYAYLAFGYDFTANEGGGDRTHDLRIKSPLLYQLSYASIASVTGYFCVSCGDDCSTDTTTLSGTKRSRLRQRSAVTPGTIF
jgi:hypothetical protein